MPAAAGLKLTPMVILLVLTFLAIVLCCLAAGIYAIVRLALGLPLLPRAKLRAVPWGVGSVVLLFGVYLILGLVVGLIAARYIGPVDAPRPAGPQAPGRNRLEQTMLLNALLSATMILIIPSVLRLTARARRSDLGLTLDQLGWNLLRGIVATFLLAPLVYLVNITASLIWKPNSHPVLDMIRENQTFQVVLIAYAMAVVIAPVFEEMLFRGVLLAWLMKLMRRADFDAELGPGAVRWSGESGQPGELLSDPMDPAFGSESAAPSAVAVVEVPEEPGLARLWVPNILTSLIFAGAHYAQWPAPIAIFFLSLGLGYVYQRTGRLAASIALHATFNGLSTTVMFLVIFSKLPMPDPVPKPAAGMLSLMNEGELGAVGPIRYSSLPHHDQEGPGSGIGTIVPDRAAGASRPEARIFSWSRDRFDSMRGGHEPTDRGSAPGAGPRGSP